MPRQPRLLLSKSFYHVMTRGNNGMPVFRGTDDYEYYLTLLIKYKADHPFDLYHYCLMPNHTHFLLQTRHANDFSIFMKQINLAYFHHYRQSYGWRGHFWQDRYKSQPVGKDAYFIQCGKYIELNPVRKGLVEHPEEYLYSSSRYYMLGMPDALLTEDIFYPSLGKTPSARQLAYQKLVVSEVVQQTRDKLIWGSVYQRSQEQRKIRQKLGKRRFSG